MCVFILLVSVDVCGISHPILLLTGSHVLTRRVQWSLKFCPTTKLMPCIVIPTMSKHFDILWSYVQLLQVYNLPFKWLEKAQKKWNWWRQQWSWACPTECPETDRKELGLPHPSLNVRKEGVSWLRFDVGSDNWLNWTCRKTWKAADTRLLCYIRRGRGIQGLGFTSKMRSWTEDQDPKHREEPSRGTASGSVFGHHETRRTDHIFFSPNAGSRVMRIYENAVIENTVVPWSGGDIDPRSNQDRW